METKLMIILIVCISLFLLFHWAKKLKAESLFSERVEEGDWIALNGIQFISIAIILMPLLRDPNFLFGYLQVAQPIAFIKVLSLFASAIAVMIFIRYNKLQQTSLAFPNMSTAGVYNYVILRVFFILIYEWFIRGLLLMTLVQRFGMITGFVFHLVIYTVLHSHKTKKEMIGCIPFGLLVGVLTIWWSSVWPAIILHLQLCLTYELPHLKKYFPHKKQATI